MTGEMNVLLIEAVLVVKGYHDCLFTVRMGEHFVLDKKSATEERYSEL